VRGDVSIYFAEVDAQSEKNAYMLAAPHALAANRLEGIPKLLRIGKETMRIVKLNIAFALVVNAIGIVLSALGVVRPLTASII
jgi:Cd2+/Zn2+-exporting ATPase